jgi:SNW domain-containing protein 1
MATELARALPKPKHAGYEDSLPSSRGPRVVAASSLDTQVVLKKSTIPPYGSRSSWRPRNQEDFGDGGAYPECNVAQYPLDMGKKKVTSGGALVLKSDKSIADTIARQGHNDSRVVHSSFSDLIPLRARADAGEIDLSRPAGEEVEATAKRTGDILLGLVTSASMAQKPKTIKKANDEPTYVRYTPHQGQMGRQNGPQNDRIIKIVNRQQDPLAPPTHKIKKIPRGPPSPPAPVMHSPPRKVTREEAEQWRIPPSVSNWKNHKGYTIALDKRLAANGRGLEDNTINNKFADFSEALYTADRLAREEVKQRAQMEQRLNERQEEQKAENLRQLAQRAREERTGASTSRRSRSRSDERRRSRSASYSSRSDSASDSEGERVREREKARRERQRENQRELRQQHMGAERRVQMMARESGRDISEKIALGLAKPTTSGEAMYDSRLFNQSSGFAAGFNEDQMYDKPLFQAQDALSAMYKPQANNQDEVEDEGETYERITKTKRFEGFSGGAGGEEREGPVQFEKDVPRGGIGAAAGGKTTAEDDPFQIGQMINDVTSGKTGGKKRYGLQEEEEEEERRGAKRARVDSDED